MTDDLLPGTEPGTHAHHDLHDDHRHGDDCGHESVVHADHQDYLHDGHRHAQHGEQWDEHESGDATTGPDGAVATAGLSSGG